MKSPDNGASIVASNRKWLNLQLARFVSDGAPPLNEPRVGKPLDRRRHRPGHPERVEQNRVLQLGSTLLVTHADAGVGVVTGVVDWRPNRVSATAPNPTVHAAYSSSIPIRPSPNVNGTITTPINPSKRARISGDITNTMPAMVVVYGFSADHRSRANSSPPSRYPTAVNPMTATTPNPRKANGSNRRSGMPMMVITRTMMVITSTGMKSNCASSPMAPALTVSVAA